MPPKCLWEKIREEIRSAQFLFEKVSRQFLSLKCFLTFQKLDHNGPFVCNGASMGLCGEEGEATQKKEEVEEEAVEFIREYCEQNGLCVGWKITILMFFIFYTSKDQGAPI